MGGPTGLSGPRSLIHQTDSSENPSRAGLSLYLSSPVHVSTSSCNILPLSSSSSSSPKLAPPLAVTHSAARLPGNVMRSKIPKSDLVILATSGTSAAHSEQQTVFLQFNPPRVLSAQQKRARVKLGSL
ncbi:unnamed protein product [Pleuronectes platessa]|uniref:Uncharacterized protein n=1 Tax=Pleuronectes platessa TaxID=8262 RepID=A0A9N7U7T6_PLEPL|nr:unnamed protein product [Pleuronectes platessa]